MRRLSCEHIGRWILAIAVGLSATALAEAGIIKIEFTGLDLVYDGTDIYDAGDIAGGSSDPLESDPLTTMTFSVDNVLYEAPLVADIFADVLIKGVSGIPVGGGSVTTTGNADDFGFHVFEDGGSNKSLNLNLGELEVIYSVFFGGQIKILLGLGPASSIASQFLPPGLELDPSSEIAISFSSTALTNVTDSGGFLTGFESSGSGNITGTALIPEPATLAIAMLGGLFVLWFRH